MGGPAREAEDNLNCVMQLCSSHALDQSLSRNEEAS